uniref:SUN domain-containing protein n=1 Tax=Anopheles culicifacies TaxID=139723 RepID=A0A182MTK8_9DIPT
MSQTHQKNLALYILCILLVVFAVFQVYVSENSEHLRRSIEAIEERPEQINDVGLHKEVHSNMQRLKEIELLHERILLLEQLNFDKLGPTDYAARVFGGEVVSAVSTSRHESSMLSRMRNMISSMYDNFHQMQCIIQDCGTCYALEGSSGTIVLKLAMNIYLDAITIEHIPKSALPTKTEVYSAMKEFSVWGTNNSSKTGKQIYLGTFNFDYENTFLETFGLLHSNHDMDSIRFVRIDIHSNHGEKFTCIYR